MTSPTIRFAMLIALLALNFGCMAGTEKPPETAESIVRKRDKPTKLVDARTGEVLTFEEFSAALRRARVIYVAERHDEALDHAAQYGIVRELHRHDPTLAVGFEAFQAPFQGALNDWTDGKLDEVELRRQTEYDDRWGFLFDYYRPILEYARQRDLQLVALNADAALTGKIASEGLRALTNEERKALPKLELNDPAHRALFSESFEQEPHGGPYDSATLDRYYVAQVLWDETMAAHVAETFDHKVAPARMVVLAGRVHVQRGLGIPQRAGRRGATPFVVVMPIDADELKSELKRPAANPDADYFWVH